MREFEMFVIAVGSTHEVGGNRRFRASATCDCACSRSTDCEGESS